MSGDSRQGAYADITIISFRIQSGLLHWSDLQKDGVIELVDALEEGKFAFGPYLN